MQNIKLNWYKVSFLELDLFILLRDTQLIFHCGDFSLVSLSLSLLSTTFLHISMLACSVMLYLSDTEKNSAYCWDKRGVTYHITDAKKEFSFTEMCRMMLSISDLFPLLFSMIPINVLQALSILWSSLDAHLLSLAPEGMREK